MLPNEDYKWDTVNCDQLAYSGVTYPVCQYPNPADDLYIEETTGKHLNEQLSFLLDYWLQNA